MLNLLKLNLRRLISAILFRVQKMAYLHQAIALNEPIACGDVAVFPGDVLLGDDDGVMVIPAHLAEKVADECTEMTLFEEFVLSEVQKGRAIIGLYPLTDEKIKSEFEYWKKNL